ncbi:SDR family NAD(P)-dependent oxidoreductase [Streptomyces sp. NPDC005803]|uniref:SDR family NAD(P)-dependent oxidoreductase n=1 Tax=Streptomyces sp. NPDC005803 TaxID=3154297 RepID=UPI0033E29AA7
MTWPGAHLGAGPSPCTRGCTTASILITGATNGLGLALAEELAEAGHQVLPHGRHPQRPVPVAQRFGAEHYIADLSAPAETQRLAAEVAARHDRLDVLVNNAGVGFTWNGNAGVGFTWNGTIRSMSADGYQQRLAVNHLSPVLLTRQLLLFARGQPITQRQHRLGRAGTDGIKTIRSISMWSGP